MKQFHPEDFKIFLDDKEVTGYITGDFVQYPRLWYKDIKGQPFGVYATCDDGYVFEINFTEDGYEEWIKPMGPTEKSPFKAKVK